MIESPYDAECLVLDTSVTSLLMGDPRRRYASEYRAITYRRPLVLPIIVISELMQGALMDDWGRPRRAAVVAYVNRLLHFGVTFASAFHWATVRAECRRQGIAVAENDAWVAATALTLDGVLLTHDRDHLRMQAAVPDLRVLSLLTP